MFRRRVFAVFSAGLAFGSLAALSGCEWFKGSDPAQRNSPVISNLSILPSSVLCAQEFLVSFRFEDPQGDISNARVTFKPTKGDAEVRTETPLWPDNVSRGSGTVSFPFSFTPKPCTGQGGTWIITVEAEDERRNTSDTLTGEIYLAAAG